MKTKVLKNGNIKVWWDKEEEFTIVGKNEPLYDTLIDGNVLVKEFANTLLKNIRDAGFDDIHGVFIDIDDSFEGQVERMDKDEFERTLKKFNSFFNVGLKYHSNDNGHNVLLFTNLDSYQNFVRNYFSTFLFKMFALKINIKSRETKHKEISGLSGFISKFANDHFKTYMEVSRTLKFDNVDYS
jgi:hypothetical protein